MQQPTRLGDPHLGKQFKNDVPVHRKGDREKWQWEDFKSSIRNSKGLHICVGDLFDQFFVPYGVVLEASRTYRDEARKHPSNTYIIIRGNHDASRIAGEISAYTVFAELLQDVPNVIVLEDTGHVEGRRLFVPWHPFKSAVEMLAPYAGSSFDEVYGHWDVRDFGNANPNLIPADMLRGIVPVVYTGHEHKRQESKLAGGLRLVQTGSMQPYAHGEDNGEMYKTLTLKELEGLDAHNLCLRVKLLPGEVLPEGIDCLQIKYQYIDPETGDDANMAEVNVEDFDLKTLFNEACDEHEVGEDTREVVWQDLRSDGS